MNPMRSLAVRIGGQPWLPRFSRQIVGLDVAIQKLTRGRFTLLSLAGLPELTLTVAGRRTGLARSTPLLCVPHDGGWLVAGSNWGAPTLPGWVHNLRGADGAEVAFKGRHHQVIAREPEGAARDALWRVMVATWPNYAKYAGRAGRPIPVFFLHPK